MKIYRINRIETITNFIISIGPLKININHLKNMRITSPKNVRITNDDYGGFNKQYFSNNSQA